MKQIKTYDMRVYEIREYKKGAIIAIKIDSVRDHFAKILDIRKQSEGYKITLQPLPEYSHKEKKAALLEEEKITPTIQKKEITLKEWMK